MTLWSRIKTVVVNRILGLNDTPHRIAWGVFLGFVVAFTPTVGIQMMFFLAVATVFRSNKVSGLPVVWITNPFTVVPIYYACWRIGAWVLGTDGDPARGQRIIDRLAGAEERLTMDRILEGEFWVEAFRTMWELGAELWLGGILLGIALGAIFYPVTVWSVKVYRRTRGG